MRLAVCIDLDDTVWRMEPWGGRISEENVSALHSLANIADIYIVTGRPEEQVSASLLRAGQPEGKWYEMAIDTQKVPRSLFQGIAYEDGLVIDGQTPSGTWEELFNAKKHCSPEYQKIMKNAYTVKAQRFYARRGIPLITDGVVVRIEKRNTVVEPITGRLIKNLGNTRAYMHKRRSRSPKQTYQLSLSTHPSERVFRYFESVIREWLGRVEKNWESHALIDTHPRINALHIFPQHVEGMESGVMHRKKEAVAMFLERNGAYERVAYIGDGENDARAMQWLKETYGEKCRLFYPDGSHKRVQALDTAKNVGSIYTSIKVMCELLNNEGH